ncbi:hypothetical protein AAG906_016672 [Vitis piasezkii]
MKSFPCERSDTKFSPTRTKASRDQIFYLLTLNATISSLKFQPTFLLTSSLFTSPNSPSLKRNQASKSLLLVTQKEEKKTTMTSTNTQIISYSPSSSSKSTHQFTYEVFLSFRGEDTRYGFTDHLYEALISSGIRTFRDDEELERGGVIASDLLKAIEESKIFVIIFSKNYGASRWCLDELVKISECGATEGRLILPIFCHVDPSHVRKQRGSYEKAFVDHEKVADEEKREKIQKWRSALAKVGNLAGYDPQKYQLIKEIIDVILKELNSSSYYMLSNDVRMIGIYGLGGIGKTTIAKVVYNNISHQFESRIFLENVRERSNDYSSLLKLQQELLNGVMREKIKNKNRFHSKRFFLFLMIRIIITSRNQHCLRVHGVDAPYKVEALSYKESIQLFCQHAFKQNIPKSDYVDLSNHVVNYVKGLPLALEVLGSFLFGKSKNPNMQVQNVLKISFDGLDKTEQETFLDIACFFKGWNENDVTRLVEDAEINIRVLSDKCLITLFGNTIMMHDLVEEMGREIVRHEHPKEPGEWSRLWDPKDISLVLRKKWYGSNALTYLIYSGTKAVEAIFLDMCTSREISFTTEAFKRMERLRLLKIYWSSGFLNYMGKRCQKLLLPEDFQFPSDYLRYLHWEGYSLKSLPSNFDGENLIELNLVEDLEFIKISLNEIPHFSNMSNLEQLDVEGCRSLDNVDSSIGFLKNLTLLNLRGCQRLGACQVQFKTWPLLKNYPPQSSSHLTSLSIRECENLKSLPSNICRLKYLEELNLSIVQTWRLFRNHGGYGMLKNYENLKSLPSSICRLKYLEELNLSGCSNLETFPEIMEDMECLKWLDLRGTCIKELPSSIEFLKHLANLQLVKCENLRSLPSSIYRLKYLKKLNLSGCSNLETFPEIMEDMECLESLDLSGTCIKELPSSIGYLNHLIYLHLSHCKNLRSLPSSIGWLKLLRKLNLNDCPNLVTGDMENLINLGLLATPSDLWCLSSLEELDLSQNNMCHIPAAITQLCNLRRLNISHCKMLEEIPELPSSLREIDAHDCPIFGTLSNPSTLLWSFLLKWFKTVEPPLKWKIINLRGNGIPRWVLHQEMGSQIRIELPMNWYEDDHFLGFGFYCLHHQSKLLSLSLKFDEEEYAKDVIKFIPGACYHCHEINDSESDQVLLVYYPKISFRDEFHSNHYMHLQASFDDYGWGRIKSCGVHLIYSQDDQQNHISSPMMLNLLKNFGDNRSTTKSIKRSRDGAEYNQAEEPHHKRSREPNTHLKL